MPQGLTWGVQCPCNIVQRLSVKRPVTPDGQRRLPREQRRAREAGWAALPITSAPGPPPSSAREPITTQRQCWLQTPCDDNPHQVLNSLYPWWVWGGEGGEVCCICKWTLRQVPSTQMAALSLPSPAIQIPMNSLPGGQRPRSTATQSRVHAAPYSLQREGTC